MNRMDALVIDELSIPSIPTTPPTSAYIPKSVFPKADNTSRVVNSPNTTPINNLTYRIPVLNTILVDAFKFNCFLIRVIF